MTQVSYFWDDNGIGDAAAYSFNKWTDLWGLFFTKDRTDMGVISGRLNELEITPNGAQTVQVDTGEAIVDGKLYKNPVAFDISGLGLTATGQIVAQKITASGTVRVVTRAVGALVQTAAQWEIQLATWSTDGAGVVTVVDTRTFAVSSLVDDFSGMQIIETIDGDGTSPTIDFTGIPQTFDHLLITGVGRLAVAAVTSNLQMRPNNDAGANYNDNNIKGNNAVYSGDENQTQNEIALGQICAGSASANRFSNHEIWIPYYKETSFNKGFIFKTGCIPNNTPAATWEHRKGGGTWLSTAAITRVVLLNSSVSNFVAGSSFTLFGIKE